MVANHPIRRFARALWRARLWLVILPVKLYKLTLSRFIGGMCRFEPTCSSYMIDAVLCYGLFKGVWAGVWRILRCNPYGRTGEDPAENFRWWWEPRQMQKPQIPAVNAEAQAPRAR